MFSNFAGSRVGRGRRALGTLAAAAANAGAPVIVQSVWTRVAASTTPTLTLPAPPSPGNILVFIQSGFTGMDVNTPSGFTLVYGNHANFSQSIGVYVRVVQAGDGAAWTSGTGVAGGQTFGLLEISGCNGINGTTASLSSSGSTLSATPTLQRTVLTLGIFESDSQNNYVSVANASLVFDGSSNLGSAQNHPSVVVGSFAKFSQCTVTYGTSSFSTAIFSQIFFVA